MENIYKSWQPSRWPTPMSGFKSPRLEYLLDKDHLEIVIQEMDGDIRFRVHFRFEGVYAYRNINESYRSQLWEKLGQEFGKTLKVQFTDFLDVLRADAKGAYTFGKATQFVIITEDDVIEVVALNEPKVTQIDSADPLSPMPGKSVIYYE